MKKISALILFAMLTACPGCKKEDLPSYVADWMNDTSAEEITLVNSKEEQKNIKVSCTRTMGGTPSPFRKNETAELVYNVDDTERLELYFTIFGDIAFNGWYRSEPGASWLGSGHSVLTISSDKTEVVTQGKEHLVIEDSYTIGGAEYNRVAIFSTVSTTHPLAVTKYFYSKHDGLIAILDADDEMWIRK